ncbi:MAG: chromate resistance protein ChrB domain-containing protein [Anaerolineaceae bacterium]
MKWVTWQHIGVDRMACIWLIKRKIDPEAEYIFVPAGAKPLPEGAEPFDIPGTRFSHHRGHCSFVALLKEHKLKDPFIQKIGQIVDEADVVQEVALEPASPGLDLICRGLRRTSRDDNEALERGCLVFDALYAELSSSNSPS